jgi:hypothetical protein
MVNPIAVYNAFARSRSVTGRLTNIAVIVVSLS